MILLWKLIKKPKEYKYKVNKIQMPRFINTELKSDSGSSDSDLVSEKVGSKFDNKLMTKFEKTGSVSK